MDTQGTGYISAGDLHQILAEFAGSNNIPANDVYGMALDPRPPPDGPGAGGGGGSESDGHSERCVVRGMPSKKVRRVSARPDPLIARIPNRPFSLLLK